ncbi:MAG: hypothetical protein ACE5JI_18025, partial [Acidobacteriota bacterium]
MPCGSTFSVGKAFPFSVLIFVVAVTSVLAPLHPLKAETRSVGEGATPPAYPAAKTGGNYMHNFYLPPPSSYPWWPSWSPDGKTLAFSMHGSIWRIRLGEDVAHELTASSTYDSSPEWSPDGRWIVYTAEEDGRSINLRLLDPATGDSRALTEGEHLNLDPAWSPDGTRLAYVSTEPNGYFNIFMLPIGREGRPGAPVPVTRDHRYGKSRLYFGDYDLHIEPTWSPDGKELLFVSNRGIPLGSGALWRVPAKENGVDRMRQIYREETLYRTRPHWSADGSRLVYSSHRGDQFNHLYVLPAEGGEPYQMTFGDWDDFHPRWSPDGEHIAYISNRKGLPALYVRETFGGAEREVAVREWRYRRPMGWLQVEVVDGESGSITPARI